MAEWIDVKDRLPEENVRVCVYLNVETRGNSHIDTDRLDSGRWVRWGEHVAHWMTLPEPPEAKKGCAE